MIKKTKLFFNRIKQNLIEVLHLYLLNRRIERSMNLLEEIDRILSQQPIRKAIEKKG